MKLKESGRQFAVNVVNFGVGIYGSQCMANSLIALGYSKLSPVNSWNSHHLNDILLQGHVLYQHIYPNRVNKQTPSIDVTDFPMQFKVNTTCFKQRSALPVLAITAANFVPNEYYTDLEMPLFDVFYIVDPHSRGQDGMIQANGSAVLVKLYSVDAVCHYIRALASTLTGLPLNQFPISLTPMFLQTQVQSAAVSQPQICTARPEHDLMEEYFKTQTALQNLHIIEKGEQLSSDQAPLTKRQRLKLKKDKSRGALAMWKSALTEEQKFLKRIKDSERKKAERANLSKETQKQEQIQAKHRMKNKRADLSGEQKYRNRFKQNIK